MARKDSKGKEFSLIIPVHNGGPVIEKSIREYYKIFSEKFENFEIIAVCNDCWDNSEQVCKHLEEDTSLPVRTICIPYRGKGYALATGFNVAKYGHMGFMDADNPFDIEKIAKLPDFLEECDVAIVSKYLKGQLKLQDSFVRRMLSLGGFVVSRTLFGLNVRDTQAGAKFFKRKVWEDINKNGKFTCTGFDFDVEFLYRARKHGFKIAEIYTPFRYEKFSTFRLKYLPGMLKRLIKMRLLK